jgi:hypothetical protein
VDDDASFPTENYKDLADAGFLGLSIPQEFGGWGFSMGEYAMVGAEIAKYCGATALTFNMHNSSMAWSRFMFDMPNLTPEEKAAFAPLRERQFRRAMKERAIYSQPISEGGQNWTSKPNQTQCRKVEGGWKINGFKKFASLAGLLRLLHHRLHRGVRGSGAPPRGHDAVRRPQGCARPDGQGRLGSAGDARHQQPRSDPEGCLRDRGRPADAARHLRQDPAELAAHDGDAVAHLYGRGAGGLRLHRRLPEGQGARPAADRPADVCDQAGGGGKMYARLANMRALWWQAFSEAKGMPSKAEVMRMYAAQYNVMEGVQEIAAWRSAPAAASRC